MKRVILFAASIFFIAFAAFCAREYQKANFLSKMPANSIRMQDSLQLSDEELLKLKKDALDGSPTAGYQLMEYYSVYKRDDKETLYWAQIAAENGEANNAYNYASFLSDDEDDLMSLLRARFWAKRAMERGEKNGEGFLSRVDAKIRKLESKEADK